MSEITVAKYQPVPDHVFRLRWVFEYSDGKAPRRGVWNGTTNQPGDSAAVVSKENLAYAIIEGEHRHTFEVIRFLVVEGPAYASAQWEAYVRAGNALGIRGSVSPRTHIAGLSFLTREERITVFVDGRVLRKPLTDHEKNWNIFEHKLGS